MAVNNNTTSLNTGGAPQFNVGQRKFNDYTATQISANISRHEYRKAIVSDAQMQSFREIVYQTVSGWTDADKAMIIAEYGDSDFLKKYGKNAPKDLLNKVCTESIIIHMDPDDLRKLKSDITAQKETLKGKIKAINRKGSYAANAARNAYSLNMKNFHAAADQINAKTNRQYLKQVKKLLPGTKTPKNIRSQYKALRKELKEVLNDCFNQFELTQYCLEMGIEIVDGMTQKDIVQAIINKTILFVDLLEGKSKKIYMNSFVNPVPFQTLLRYTSKAYLTGMPGIDPYEWIQLREGAKRGKAAVKEQSKMARQRQKNRTHLFGQILTESKEMQELTGTSGTSTKAGMKWKLRLGKDQGVLADKTDAELREYAVRYGINPNIRDRNKLKTEIYIAMAADKRRTEKLSKNNIIERIFRPNAALSEERRTLLSLHTGFVNRNGEFINQSPLNELEGASGEGTQIAQAESEEDIKNHWKERVEFMVSNGVYTVPTVEFSPKTGQLTSVVLNRAVPVYLIGAGRAGLNEKFEENSKLVQSEHEFVQKLLQNAQSNTGTADKDEEWKKSIFDKIGVDETEVKPVVETKNKSTITDNFISPFEVPKLRINQNIISVSEIKELQSVIPVFVTNDFLTMGKQTHQKAEILINKDTDKNSNEYKAAQREDERLNTQEEKIRDIFTTKLHGQYNMQRKIQMASDIKNISLESDPNLVIKSMNEKQITMEARKAALNFKDQKTIKLATTEISNYAGTNELNKIRGNDVSSVYVVNKIFDSANNPIISAITSLEETVSDQFSALKLGLASQIISAPYGVGVITNPTFGGSVVKDKILQASQLASQTIVEALAKQVGFEVANTGATITKLASGGKSMMSVPKFAEGGESNTVITGDAAGNNIFANGAKPELVSSNGNINVIPLNKTGTENQNKSIKVERMTPSERKNSLATAISSHVIKFNYALEGEEISNAGEAIKVYNVKPGITDKIDIGGEQISLVEMIQMIYNRMVEVSTNGETANTILTTIAAKPTQVINSTSGSASDTSNNSIGTFSSSLDDILGGY